MNISSMKMIVIGSKNVSGRVVKVIDQRINMPFATETMAGLRKEIVKRDQINLCYMQRDRQLRKPHNPIN